MHRPLSAGISVCHQLRRRASAATQKWDSEDTGEAGGELGLYISGDLLEDNRARSLLTLLLVPFQPRHNCSQFTAQRAG